MFPKIIGQAGILAHGEFWIKKATLQRPKDLKAWRVEAVIALAGLRAQPHHNATGSFARPEVVGNKPPCGVGKTSPKVSLRDKTHYDINLGLAFIHK